jgi:hypothetical protein
MFLLWLKRSWCTTSLEAKYQLLKGFGIKLWNKATNTTTQILIVFLRCCKKMKSLIVLLRRYLFAFHRSNQNVRPTSGGTCACLVCPAPLDQQASLLACIGLLGASMYRSYLSLVSLTMRTHAWGSQLLVWAQVVCDGGVSTVVHGKWYTLKWL